MLQMAHQVRHSDQEQYDLAAATLATARRMVSRELGGRDGVPLWLGPVLQAAVERSR
jgi:hypothetical protein